MKASKLLHQIDVSDYVDYPRIFICNNLTGDEPYLMVCPERLEYEMYDEDVAEDYYYNDDSVKKMYIDIGDKVAITYFSRQGLMYNRSVIEDIEYEDRIIYLENGSKVNIDEIESIGVL